MRKVKYVNKLAKPFKPIKVGNKGALFEILVSKIEEATKTDNSIKITRNKFIQNIDGFDRQIDVFIESEINGYPIGIAIECKEYKNKIDVEKIECFISKCLRIPTINKKIFVSQKGFTEQAIKLASINNIELIRLDKVNVDKIFDWMKPYRFYLQKRFINITEVEFQNSDFIMNTLTDIDSSKIRFDGYGKEISMREFCTSYMVNLRLSDWRMHFKDNPLNIPVNCGYIIKPDSKMLIFDGTNEIESPLMIFKVSIYEESILLEKTDTKEYKVIEGNQSKASIMQLVGKAEDENAIVNIVIAKDSNSFQINYSIVKDKKIICSETDTYYLNDIINN